MTQHDDRGSDPLAPGRGGLPIDDPFSLDDPAAREREQRRREREQRRRERAERGKDRRHALGRRVRAADPEAQAAAPGPAPSAPIPPAPTPGPARAPAPAPTPAQADSSMPTPREPNTPDPLESSLPAPQRFEPRARPETVAARPDRLDPRSDARATSPRGGAVWRRRILALALLAVVAALVWFGLALFQPFAGEGDGKVVVEIPKGATADEIADLLDKQGVISNASLFGFRLTLAGKSDEIAAGTYTLASGMSYGSAIDALSKAPGTRQITVTVPEGYTLEQTAKVASGAGLEGDYKQAASKPPKGFDPSKYGAPGDSSLEGFLFPATYELEPRSRAADLVAQQLAAFERSIKQVDMKDAESKNLDVYDVITIASMIDREVQVPEERELVSAVIYNRLGSGEPLGIDATLRYALENYDEQLTQSDLATDTPYNTRLVAGLPPTPIGNPGLDSLEAAAEPAKVDYRFYVVKPGTCGEHVFTASEGEFEQAVADYQQALEEQGGSPTEC